MIRKFIIAIMLSASASIQAQTVSLEEGVADSSRQVVPEVHWLQMVQENRQRSFDTDLPGGNFSGITQIGENLYAVVDDKKNEDGFYVFNLKFNKKGDISSAYSLGYRESGLLNRDVEDIVYVPSTNTVFTSGEKHNNVLEYTLDGKPTSRELQVPEIFKNSQSNRGLEALAYNANTHHFWTTSEDLLTGDSILRLQSFGEDLLPREQYTYQMDPATKVEYGQHLQGVSAMTALDDGSLLVLEREVFMPSEKIGSWCNCKIYQIVPGNAEKHLIHEWRTTLTLFNHEFANYEGMCLGPKLDDGTQVLVLLADSQNRYWGFLSDWFKTLLLR